MRREGHEPLVQEHVAGHLMAFIALVDRHGNLLGVTQQEAERIWPSDSGVSVRAHTVPIDPALARRVQDMIRALGWFGLMELQFMRPPAGEPQVIDFNGRFYGSMSLAIGAGPNLPDAWGRLATGRPVGELPSGKPGVRYQWLEADLRRSLREERGSRLVEVLGTLRYARGAVHSVLGIRDPAPAASLIMLRIRHALRKWPRWRASRPSTA